MYNEVVRVEKIENGYQVSCYEPAPMKKASKKGADVMPSSEPWKTYFAKDIAGVCALIEQKLPAIKRDSDADEYGAAFNEAGDSGDE